MTIRTPETHAKTANARMIAVIATQENIAETMFATAGKTLIRALKTANLQT